MATMTESETRTDVIRGTCVPENVDLAGLPTVDAAKFVQSVLDRAAEAQDDLAIALLVRARSERSGGRISLERFLEGQGFDIAELEAELDSEVE